MKPNIDKSKIPKEIKVRAGEPFDIKVPAEVEPPPTIDWQKDGKDIHTNERMDVTDHGKLAEVRS